MGRGFAETTRDLTRLVGPMGTVDAFDPCAGSAWSRVSDAIVGRDLDEAFDYQLERGCAAEVLRAAGNVGREERAAMVLALRSALRPYVTARGVVMASSSWTIRATAAGAGAVEGAATPASASAAGQ